MSDDMKVLEKARSSGFAIIRGNINAGALEDLEPKSFDFIVAEDVLVTARYPGDFLLSAMRVADKLVIGNKNKAKQSRQRYKNKQFAKLAFLGRRAFSVSETLNRVIIFFFFRIHIKFSA